MPLVAAKCTQCGANLQVESSNDAAICSHCGTPFITEKAITNYNITNSINADVVNVYGGETADEICNRALEWLKLGDEAKAISVLQSMIDKYPGDRRGWQKLEEINENIRRAAQETARKREAIALAACEEVRNGRGEKWVSGKKFILADEYGTYPCVQQLLKEGQENAQFLRDLINPIGMPRKRNGEIKEVRYSYEAERAKFAEQDKYWSAMSFVLGIQRICFMSCLHQPNMILGNLLFFSGKWDGEYSITVTDRNLTKSFLQQAIVDAGNAVKSNICLICGGPKGGNLFKSERYCKACSKKR